MEAREFLNICNTAEQLKNNTRHSWTSSGRRESVAEHSWRLTIMAYFLSDEFPEADIDKVIRMCMFHDMGEAFTGDIPAFEKNERHEMIESQKIDQWIASMPTPYREDLTALFEEMDAQQTLEAKLYKALDKLEALISHNEADISTWLPLEYELNLTYGEKQVEFSEYLKNLRAQINQDTLDKIEEGKKRSGKEE